MRRLRTFVALRVGPGPVRRLRREADRLLDLDPGLKPPATDDFHLTVQFLGETAEADIPGIARALEAAARTVDPLEVRYGGLGAFPVPARARVVFAAVREAEGGGDLPALSRAVGRELGRLGFPPEARAWHPHVTLGRLRRLPRPALVQAVDAGRDLDLGGEVLSEVKLILSDPSEGRYRYIDLTTVALGRDPGPGGV